MAAVSQYHFLHGAVLAKIVRKDRPLALTLIETNQESWATYKLNDESVLYIKSCQRPRMLNNGAIKCFFTFHRKHIDELIELRKNNKLYIALVCAGDVDDVTVREIAFLEDYELDRCLDYKHNGSQNITVEIIQGNKLRVFSSINSSDRNKLKIERNRLDEWILPGA